MMEFFRRLVRVLRGEKSVGQNIGLDAVSEGAHKGSVSANIIKSRRPTLAERYRLISDEPKVEGVFKELAIHLVQLCDEISGQARGSGASRMVFRELGSTDDRRSYLFMKPMNEHGLLMERNGAGWRISLAEKIVGQSLFLRSDQDPWDVVTIWADPVGECLTRVRSLRFGQELMTLAEYERRLSDGLRNIFTTGSGH